jgi:hypothetical protein
MAHVSRHAHLVAEDGLLVIADIDDLVDQLLDIADIIRSKYQSGKVNRVAEA